MTDELARRLAFVRELDRAKMILRRNPVSDGSRRENDAEHSWHLAMAVLVLADHGPDDLDLAKAIRMALVHDIVEIDAGDTYVYDTVGALDKADRERAAAERLFGMLPEGQGADLHALWEEFEERETAEARFVGACDRLLPLMLNHATEGEAWRSHGIRAEQVTAVNARIADGSEDLWAVARGLIGDAVRRGWLPD